MAMQKKAWMTGELFKAWLEHFDACITEKIGKEDRHLLILDGHGSHVSLEVVAKAHQASIDIIALPAHTSHKLQPLDVSVFKSLKVNFRRERDIWQQWTEARQATKSELASIVAKAIESSFTETNIKSGFPATGIWPLDATTVQLEEMPCNHINLVEDTIFELQTDDTNTPIEEDISQVACTPMHVTIEDKEIQALNILATRPRETNEDIEQGISFSQLLGVNINSTFEEVMEAGVFLAQGTDIENHNLHFQSSQTMGPQTMIDTSDSRGSLYSHQMQQQTFADENASNRLTNQMQRTPSRERTERQSLRQTLANENTNPNTSNQSHQENEQQRIIDLLRVPTTEVCIRQVNREPFVDYTNNLILTSTQYMDGMQALSAKKKEIAKAKAYKKEVKDRRKVQVIAEKEAARKHRLDAQQAKESRKNWEAQQQASEARLRSLLWEGGSPQGLFLWPLHIDQPYHVYARQQRLAKIRLLRNRNTLH